MRCKFNYIVLITFFLAMLYCTGCKKLVEIPEPVNTITNSETFSSDANATSAVIAIYNNLIADYSPGFGDGAITVYAGLSSDELVYLYGSSYPELYQFNSNTLSQTNQLVLSYFWSPAYFNIYMANAAIEGLQLSASVSHDVKVQLTGEAKFLRALCYFYLVNLFGRVPLVTSTAWANTQSLPSATPEEIYQQIVADLKDAQNTLGSDYSISGGERIRANKWAATALLARVYLYMGNWASAEEQASAVIDNAASYHLDDLSTVFLKNSDEAILQWGINDQVSPYAVPEARSLIPEDPSLDPNYYLSDQLLSAFEPGDLRRTTWIDSSNNSVLHYYPYKYKIRNGNEGDVQEYYMVLRLAEQYLIRAEASAELNSNLDQAINDLNAIRSRAGLDSLSDTLDQTQILDAVTQENRVEFFAEWGHRWLDLKRTGKADQALSNIKPSWQSTQELYPIPLSELQVNPNMTQNPGY